MCIEEKKKELHMENTAFLPPAEENVAKKKKFPLTPTKFSAPPKNFIFYIVKYIVFSVSPHKIMHIFV